MDERESDKQQEHSPKHTSAKAQPSDAKETEYSPLAQGETRQVGINEPISTGPVGERNDDFSGL